MTRYTVSLDGTVKARGLSFQDAIHVGTDLSVKIGHVNASERIKINEEDPFARINAKLKEVRI